MTVAAPRCGAFDAGAAGRLLHEVQSRGLERVRVAWADLHGSLRSKTLMLPALAAALQGGVGFVSTLLLKDTSDRTALPVFTPGGLDALPGFGAANNLLAVPDPASLQVLPWTSGTGWLRADLFFDDGTPVAVDPRRQLQAALARLAAAGYGLVCGLEVEFHVYRITDPRLDPARAAWPAEPPDVALIHPGYHLLGEDCTDQADEALRIVQHIAQGLTLPLRSLEIEFGPSQVEAVFDATDALTAADQMVLFRSSVRQALRRAGYHASFMCRPPFPNVMSSGWHLHQSLANPAGDNSFVRDHAAVPEGDARQVLSETGCAWLAGLLAHAPGCTLLAAPTVNAYGRYGQGAMAPQAPTWGRDHRGAMLRVLGDAGDAATRIENRLGEPMANPYLYIASQVHAGLAGLAAGLRPPPSADAQAAGGTHRLPASLPEAITAFEADPVLAAAFGAPFVHLYTRVKRAEAARHAQAADGDDWQRREYFGRF